MVSDHVPYDPLQSVTIRYMALRILSVTRALKQLYELNKPNKPNKLS